MALSQEEIKNIFKDTGALLEGHFILTSGLHSAAYFQCAKVFQYPRHAEALARDIADHFRGERIDVVVSPAVGGIVFGQEVARLLPARAIFTERAEGRMSLRRGFEISAGGRVLVAEDVTTTGGSVTEVIEVARNAGAEVVAVTAVVDRSSGRARFDVPYFSLMQMNVVNYEPSVCPLCRSGSVAVKPGSRGLKS
ncbi:MAG: orotate phosphoribosyltransferase [Candidatus Aminicenantes bacterium RBG_13_62_12]|nr:MAG: orotate phosphoribosyltransferase [Candidatus Aminicenantes bacterium RBG_13_62_12]